MQVSLSAYFFLDFKIIEEMRLFLNSLLLILLVNYAQMDEMVTEAQETDQEDFKIYDTDYINTKITWINSTHLIKLVSFLVDQNRTTQSDVIVVDTRCSNEYNGWSPFGDEFEKISKLNKDESLLYSSKNGHISFAHNLDSDWLDLFNDSALTDFIEYRYGFVLFLILNY